MALLFYDGFETAPNVRPGWVPSTMNSGAGRNGGRAITNSGYVRRGITPSAQVIVGIASNVDSSFLGNNNTTGCLLMSGTDSGFTDQLALNLSPTGQVFIRRGGTSGTVIAASTAVVTLGQWFYLEAKFTIADAGGICIVRLNGVEILNFTGDTRNGGGSTNIDLIGFAGGGGGAGTKFVDDLVIMDGTGGSFNDFIGDRTIRAIRPNGNGATNQWVGSDANSVDNYLLVDEDPFSSVDYTGSATPGDRDIYAFSDLSIAGTVNAVQVLAYAAKSDAGARSIKTLTRSAGGTVLTSGDATLQTSYGVVDSPILQTDADAAAWTVASVNSAEFGVEVA